MEINTTFSIWDKAYVIYNNNVHEVKIDWIKVYLDKDNKNVRYAVTIYVPAWILKVNEIKEWYKEEEVFLDIEEVKKEIALREKYGSSKAFSWQSAYISWIQWTAFNPYFNINRDQKWL